MPQGIGAGAGRPRTEDRPFAWRLERLEERVESMHTKLDQAKANHRYYVSKRMPVRTKLNSTIEKAIRRYNSFATLVGIQVVEEIETDRG